MYPQLLPLVILLMAGSVFGDEPPEEITSMVSYWSQAGTAGDREFVFQPELTVLYYDRDWTMMFVRWDGMGTYFDAPGNLPVRTGQRIRLDGFARPGSDGIQWARTSIEVLEESALGEPVVVEGEMGDLRELDLQWVEIEGLVERQHEYDPTHLRLELVAEGRSLTAIVNIDQNEPVPQFEGAFVRLLGSFTVTSEPGAAEPRLQIWVSGLERVKWISDLDSDPRFEIPAVKIEALVEAAPDSLVRIEGTVHDYEAGVSVTVRDETGQVKLLTRQASRVALGERIEAIGVPDAQGLELLLHRSFYRQARAGEGPSSVQEAGVRLPRLRLIDQARVLDPDEAEQGYPVQFTGVVTWSDPDSRSFFFQDPSGGIRVELPEDGTIANPVTMSLVDVTGITAMGNFGAKVKVVTMARGTDYDVVTARETLSARPLTFEQAITGAEYGQWVEMRGYVRSVLKEGDWTRMEIITSGGSFSALVADRLEEDLTGTMIRFRGVFDLIAGPRGQLRGIRIGVPSVDLVEVEEAMPGDVFETPRRSIGDLVQFRGMSRATRRVRVSGVVVLHQPGELIYVQDGEDGLLVLSRQTDDLVPGDRVDVVGFPGREAGRLILREAVYRRTASGPDVDPVSLVEIRGGRADLDGRLVRIEGTLLDLTRAERGWRLTLLTEEKVVEARLVSSAGPAVTPGSVVEVTGVYRVELDEYQQPRSFALNLRSAGDLRIVRAASWWNPGRVVWAIAILSGSVLLSGGWGMILRQRNRLLHKAQLDLKTANDELEDRVAQRSLAFDRAREELAREHRRLEFIFDSVPMGIALTTVKPDGTTSLWINSVQWALAGMEKPLDGRFDFSEMTHPEDRPLQHELHSSLERGEVDQYALEKRYVRPDGEIVWVKFIVQRRQMEEGGYEDLSTVVDVTPLKRSQEEAAYERDLLRSLLDHSPDYIYFKDLESRFIKTSRSHAECLGISSPDEMVGKTDFDFFSDEHANQAFADEQEVIRTETPLIGKVESETYKTQPGQFWVTTTKIPFRDKEGNVIGVFGISRDITALKNAEAELERTHRRLLEASRLAGMAEVATSVLHNVGNVLNSVNITATLIDEQLRRSRSANIARVSELLKKNAANLGTFLTEDPKGRQIPSYMESLTEHLSAEREEMLVELKSLRSKVDHIKEIVAMQQSCAKISGVSEVLSVVELVEDALRINSEAFMRHEVTIVRDFVATPEITVERHKVLQILVNLLRNAKEACGEMEQKEVTVRISEEDGSVLITVVDNGVGIISENLSRIFALGFTTREGGHGFGLHSGALAARELGGTLNVCSEGLGKGATFTLALPTQPPEARNGQ